MMNELQKNHYKDKKPEETIEFLERILRENNIEVEEEWIDKSYIGTYSLRVNFKGTNKGTNGKGVSREYAKASAYAELFERFQNGVLINPRFIPKDKSKFNCMVAADEKKLTAEELVKGDSPFIKMYFQRRNMINASTEEKIKSFFDVNKIDYMLSGEENSYISLPFYDVKKQVVHYLPHWVYSMYYGSNGMSAGNTEEEAIVQGLSEIIERYVHKQLFTMEGGLPTVPDKYIASYPELYEKYEILRRQEGYEVCIKDCSLGGKYPVVGLVILQKNTCKYGIKLGCHPDFGIALERTLTEAAQGTDVLEYVNRSHVDFFNTNVTDWVNMTNSFKVGLSQYPYQLFSKKLAYKFVKPKDISGWSNKEICKKMMRDLMDEGYDILIRDVSTFGFPSYHIIVPGMSELIDASDDKVRASNTRVFASALLQNPKSIDKENCKYIIASIGYYSRSLMENGLESYYQDASGFKLPYSEIGASAIYLASMCHIFMGNYLEAYKKITLIEKYANQSGILSEKEMAKLRATSKYLSAFLVLKEHRSVMYYMNTFFEQEICEFIDDLFSDVSNIIIKQFPNVQDNNISIDSMERIYEYADILKQKQIICPIQQSNLRNLF